MRAASNPTALPTVERGVLHRWDSGVDGMEEEALARLLLALLGDSNLLGDDED